MKTLLIFLGGLGLAVSSVAHAHHAFVGVFNMNTIVEVEGEITGMLWRNPHVRFSLLDADGVTWEVESNSVSILGRMNISPDLFGEGDQVRVAGNPALDGGHELWVNNILLADDREVVMRPGVARRWSGEKLGTDVTWLAGGSGELIGGEQGFFRVWSTHFTGDDRWLWPDDYPLTESAAAIRNAYDPVTDNPIANCAAKGMPWIMEQPYPMQLTKENGHIRMRIEEYDAVRTFYMDGRSAERAAASPLGFSIGHWEGDDLIVETSHIDYPQFNSTGIPQSTDIRLVERFSLDPDGSRLAYEAIVTDPATFSEPVLLDKAWIYRPGEEVKPYECTVQTSGTGDQEEGIRY